jgi:putative acetyltransferase
MDKPHSSVTDAMTIRRAQPGDHAGLLALWERSVRATHVFLGEAEVLELRPLVATELGGDACEWWVMAGDREQLLGFLGYTPNVIEGLFVDPDCRGRGVGTRLVAFAQQLAVGSLRVDVNEQNSAARGFYESLGFTMVGRSALDSAGRPFPLLHMERLAVSVPPRSPRV